MNSINYDKVYRNYVLKYLFVMYSHLSRSIAMAPNCNYQIDHLSTTHVFRTYCVCNSRNRRARIQLNGIRRWAFSLENSDDNHYIDPFIMISYANFSVAFVLIGYIDFNTDQSVPYASNDLHEKMESIQSNK